jgi:outer membrane protein insertion porin family
MSKKIRLFLALTGLIILKGYAQTDAIQVDSIIRNEEITQMPDTIPVEEIIPPEEIPDFTYSLNPKKYTIADIKVKLSGPNTNNYEDFVLIGISGLSIGDVIEVPGGEETADAMRRYWRNGLFSDVSILGTRVKDNNIWLEIQLTLRPRISIINFNGIKKSEREDLQNRLGLRPGSTLTTNASDRAVIYIKKYL